MRVPILPQEENSTFFCTGDAHLRDCESSHLRRQQCLWWTVVTIWSYFHRYTEVYLSLGYGSWSPTSHPRGFFILRDYQSLEFSNWVVHGIFDWQSVIGTEFCRSPLVSPANCKSVDAPCPYVTSDLSKAAISNTLATQLPYLKITYAFHLLAWAPSVRLSFGCLNI